MNSSRRTLFLITIALGVLLNPLNSSMISVAIARIQVAFHLTFTTVSWLISTFYLASAIAQPVMGKIADLLGHKKAFLIGLGTVAVASLLSPLSPSFGWLILFRILQAIGSSAIYPAGMAIVRNRITDGQAKALAFLAVFSSASAAFGPTIGGFLIHWWDWPAIFAVNIPIIILSFLLALWVLPTDVHHQGDGTSTWRGVIYSLDIPGILLFTLAVVGILMFLLSLSSSTDAIIGVLGVLGLGLFIWRELKCATPFIPFQTFAKNRTLMWVDIQFVTVNIIFYSVFFGIPTYLQEVRHLGEQTTGLLMFFLAGFSLVVSPLAGRWIDRSGSRPALFLAGILMGIGSLIIITLHQSSPLSWICIMLIPLGISNGLNSVGIQTALFEHAPRAIIGTASGLLMTARYLGTIISSVLLDLVFGPALTTERLRILGTILVLVSILVVWMSARLPKGQQHAVDT